MASIELDASVKQALRHLHSNARDSTERVRGLLDELIRLQCGSAKTMAVALPKKYLAEERAAAAAAATAPPLKASSTSDKSKVSAPAVSPQQIRIPERSDDEGSAVMDGELAFELLEEDLTCAVCRQIACTAANRLVECETCRALYHQECHKPAVRDGDVGAAWQCSACFKPKRKSPPPSQSAAPAPVVAAAAAAAVAPATQPASKAVVPNINIISADKRLQIMKKKAAKQQENKRKHSSK